MRRSTAGATARRTVLVGFAALATVAAIDAAGAADGPAWPPALEGAKHGTVVLETPDFLKIPENVAALVRDGKAVPFDVAKTPPQVALAYHGDLGTDAVSRRLWSSWGDIGLARDGKVYSGIGDHGDDKNGDARCFVYVWSPKDRTLRQVVDMNRIVPPVAGKPSWSKIHAKLDEGPDGAIYLCCTLNDGNRAASPDYAFDDRLPGGQIYRYDPKTDKTETWTSLPVRRCTATSLYDAARDVWWCNLEGGRDKDALWGVKLATKEVVYRGEEGSVAFNRAFALLNDGRIVFNGPKGLCHLDPATGRIAETAASFPDSPGIRCATRQSRSGDLWGVTYKTAQLYRYSPQTQKIELLGPSWLAGEYTTVCELSPDERFVYYLPGAHGKAWQSGTPVIQYEVATGRRKVLAFLAPAFEAKHDYVPAGTYGVKITADGSTLYVNFNGHPTEKHRPPKMKPIGFGLTAFAEIRIPASER